MRKRIVITDLTRMQQGKVCVAGYDKDHRCVRPVLYPKGILEKDIVREGQPVIFPFALVEFDFLKEDPNPPHTEDVHFTEGDFSFVQKVTQRRKVLEWSLFPSVQEIFEQTIHTDFGYYVLDRQGPRSTGTIIPKEITAIIYEPGPEGAWDYRIIFRDGAGTQYRLKITDLTWHYYCDAMRREKFENDHTRVTSHLTTLLMSGEVCLRIGLSRGWKKFPDKCFLQVNGIHTFPDYLEGKTFGDYFDKKF